MLSFPGSQSINNTWIMQDVIIPDGMQGVYIRYIILTNLLISICLPCMIINFA